MTSTILLAIGLIGTFFALMSVRLIFVKNGEFKGTCASQNPMLNENGETCSYCGRKPGECKTEDVALETAMPSIRKK